MTQKNNEPTIFAHVTEKKHGLVKVNDNDCCVKPESYLKQKTWQDRENRRLQAEADERRKAESAELKAELQFGLFTACVVLIGLPIFFTIALLALKYSFLFGAFLFRLTGLI